MASNHTKDIDRVIPAFLAGRARDGIYATGGLGGFRGLRLWTDGTLLYSYKLAIGRLYPLRGTAPQRIDCLAYDNAPTATTKRHVAALTSALYADGTFDVRTVASIDAIGRREAEPLDDSAIDRAEYAINARNDSR
jgi:hypothetical protein